MPEVKREPKADEPKKRATQEAKCRRWKARIKRGEKRLQKAGGNVEDEKTRSNWARLIDIYSGDQYSTQKDIQVNDHQITTNVIKANLDSLRPQLYFRNPRVNVSTKNPDILERDIYETDAMGNPVTVPVPGPDGQPIPVPLIKIPRGSPVRRIFDEQGQSQVVDAREQAKLAEEVVAYYHAETPVKKEARKSVNDALILPYGAVKQTWMLKTERVEPPLDELDADQTRNQETEVVFFEGPWIERIPPWQILFDADLKEWDLEKAKWICHVKMMTKREAMSDPYLDQKVLKEAKPATHQADGADEDPDGNVHPDDEIWKFYEIHDLVENRLMVWCDGTERFCRDEKSPYKDLEGSCFTALGFDDIPNDAFPLPLVKQILSKQEGLNFALSYMLNHVRRFNTRWFHDSNTFSSEEEKQKFLMGADNTLVQLTDSTRPPSAAVPTPISGDLYQIINILKHEITEEMGVTAFQRGAREAGVDTATEANLIAGGADNKTNEKRDKVTEFYKTIARKTLQLCQIFMDKGIAIEISGQKGQQWRKLTKREIAGEFSLEVDVFSGQPFDPTVEKRQAMELFSILQQDPFVDPYKFREWLLKKFQADPDALLKTEFEAKAAAGDQEAALQDQAQKSAGGNGNEQQQRPVPVTQGPDRASDIMGQILGANRAQRGF